MSTWSFSLFQKDHKPAPFTATTTIATTTITNNHCSVPSYSTTSTDFLYIIIIWPDLHRWYLSARSLTNCSLFPTFSVFSPPFVSLSSFVSVHLNSVNDSCSPLQSVLLIAISLLACGGTAEITGFMSSCFLAFASFTVLSFLRVCLDQLSIIRWSQWACWTTFLLRYLLDTHTHTPMRTHICTERHYLLINTSSTIMPMWYIQISMKWTLLFVELSNGIILCRRVCVSSLISDAGQLTLIRWHRYL